MDTTVVTDLLQEALSKYPALGFFDSDQGSQYTSHIVMERFFSTLKYNCIFINDFKNIKALKEGMNS